MKKALLFLFDGYCEFEITPAISMLRGTHEITTFAMDKAPKLSEAGLLTLPSLTVSDIKIVDYEALIIPGGDLKPIAEAEEFFQLVEAFHMAGKVVSAICSGVFVLAKAGILQDVPYTVTLAKYQREFLGVFPEEYFVYKPIVASGNILTAQGHAYVQFGIELNKMLRTVNDETIDFYNGKRNVMMEGKS
ncbi:MULTISPECIES: DJ-1/PfpI family protein [Sutcliffiella]|uniref:DJ-1/PfpI family protein n=1 Tax=Sutcliffiella TaxID=2837511 RepID=UPI0022DE1159|nr:MULTISPECIES: DJ-1/PfpI family protein [Sutcliffiella]MED4019221.1 DJ-1/PfpI family protein [Sutcliffiella cohnii]WBL13731.1 DJ-1/PfpI family protein [Sutcliffiella sp. NC1]